MPTRPTAGSIDEYIAAFPLETQARLSQIRELIRATAPDATETISYAIPTFDLNGKHLVHFAGFAKHVGFYPIPTGMEAFKAGARTLQAGEGLGSVPARPAAAARPHPPDRRVPGGRGSSARRRRERDAGHRHTRAKGLFDSNSYLIAVEGGFVLIDTSVAGRRKALVAALEAAGCRPGDLRLIVITHVHSDHVGNAAYLHERYGAPIAMHEGDAGKAERGDMFWRPEGLTGVDGVARALSRLVSSARFEAFTPDVRLSDGQSLAEWGLAATVHHLPGHSPGSICVLTDEGALFCGDLLTNTRGGPARNSIIDVRRDYDRSVARLGELPIVTVYPGHGQPFDASELKAVLSGE